MTKSSQTCIALIAILVVSVAVCLGRVLTSRLSSPHDETQSRDFSRSSQPSASQGTTAARGQQADDAPIQRRVYFDDVAKKVGISFKHYFGPTDMPTILETTGSGGAFCDYDDDGRLDIYIVNSCDPEAPGKDPRYTNVLYRNVGGANTSGKLFEDVTAQAGIGDAGYGMGCVFGDYDNDGDEDLYVTNWGRNTLYRNNGDGTFTDATDIAGVGDNRFGTSCAFADYDRDGDLDLYVANYVVYRTDGLKYCWSNSIRSACPPTDYDPQADILYRNEGDGSFTDVTKEAGVLDESGKGLGVVFGDYDNDGDVDIFVANDSTHNPLYRNRGDGAFENVGLISGVAFAQDGTADSGMGTDLGDYDGDGDLDLFLCDFQDRYNILYRNEGGFFSDVSAPSGFGQPTVLFLGFGAKFIDYDNDGDLDVFIANGHVFSNAEDLSDVASYKQLNQLFRNDGGGSFSDVSAVSGSGLAIRNVSRSAVIGDYDNDGDADILVTNSGSRPNLLRNQNGNANSFLMVKLVGRKSNRDAIGARVSINVSLAPSEANKNAPPCPAATVSPGENSASAPQRMPIPKRFQMREVKSGSGYLSHHDPRLLFGLGSQEKVDTLEVRWPSGIGQALRGIRANQIIVIKELAPETEEETED